MTPMGKARLSLRRVSFNAGNAEAVQLDSRIPADLRPELTVPMKITYRWLFLILFLGAFCLSSLTAQSQTPSSDVEKRINELKEPEQNIPDNQIELSDELRRIDDELARRRAESANYDATNKELDGLKTSAAKVFQDIDVLD